jgi:RNA polymerase sigma-70 factor (ECF subfamily)
MTRTIESFERILHETQDVIRAYIAGLGVTHDEVDDIAQEVYVAFYKGMDRMPEAVTPIRWLKGIARNLSNNYFRRTKRERARRYEAIAELLSQTEAAQRDAPRFATGYEALRTCLQKLSEKSRRLIALKYEQNLTATAISRQLNVTASAVRMALLRIRENLRQCLQDSPGERVVHEH